MNEKLKFKLLMFIRYLGDSFFYPYLAKYLKSLTFGESKIGILIAIVPLIAILTNPIYSKLCKNTKILRNVLHVIGIAEAIAIILLLYASNFYLILAIIILLSISGTSHYGLMDAYCTHYAEINNMNFSNFRVYGSIAYVIGTTISGIVTDKFGYGVAFIICAIIFILTSYVYLLFKPVYDEVAHKEEKRSYKEVFKNKKFILYLFFFIFCYGSLKASNNYFGLLLEHRGISNSGYGIIYSGLVLVEVLSLFLFNKINDKLNFRFLMLLCIFGLAIMSFINSSSLPNWLVITFCFFRGLSFGIILHVNYKILVSMVGLKNGTIVILLEDLGINILVIFTNTFGGQIIEYISYETFYLILGIICFVDLIYYLLFVRKYVPINDEKIIEIE